MERSLLRFVVVLRHQVQGYNNSHFVIRAETWTLKAPDDRKLSTFHNQCVGTILDVSKFDGKITLLLSSYRGNLVNC